MYFSRQNVVDWGFGYVGGAAAPSTGSLDYAHWAVFSKRRYVHVWVNATPGAAPPATSDRDYPHWEIFSKRRYGVVWGNGTAVAGTFALSADAASYTLTGINAALVAGANSVFAVPGIYAITG